jgi:hypothetical protein
LDDEFERMWPEEFLLYFKVLFKKMHIETGKIQCREAAAVELGASKEYSFYFL